MAYNYNNYFNNCGVNCGDTQPCTNTGYSNHGDYSKTSCSNTGYGNHSDYSDSTYSKSGCYDHLNYKCPDADYTNGVDHGCSDHQNETNNHYSESGCSDHKHESYTDYSKSGCTDYKNGYYHANHFDNTKDAPDMRYSISGINDSSTADWVKLGDAIGDLKKLRDAIADMPNRKLDAEGKDFTMYLSSNANSDDKFAAGQTPKAAQFNETRSNIKNLWKKIWGSDGSGWPAEVKHGDKMKKDDYQKLFNKVDSLARLDQSRFYSNHYNSSKGGQNNGQ